MMRYTEALLNDIFLIISLVDIDSTLCLPFFMICSFVEQEAISYSETRGRVLLNNYCQALRCRPHQVSAVPVGEHSGTTENSGD